MAKQILTATSLKKVWEIVKTPLHVGDFLSWQITAELCKLKLIRRREDFAALGPGARAGLRKVFDEKVSVSNEQDMTKNVFNDKVSAQAGLRKVFYVKPAWARVAQEGVP